MIAFLLTLLFFPLPVILLAYAVGVALAGKPEIPK